jgi:amino acid transporter
VLVVTLTGTFVYAATISVIARLLAYGATCAAPPVLRRRESAPTAKFVAPVGVAVAVIALLLVAWLVANSTAVQTRDAGIAAAIGLLIYFASRRKRQV